MAYDYGIYTLLDFHQDDLSEKFCGEGLPNWATKTLDGLFGLPAPVEWPWDLGLDDLPSKEQCNRHFWGDYSNTLSGSYGYQALYDNVDGIQDALGYFWRNVTEIFKDSDAVLGYEFFNEPNRGFYWGNPLRWYISGYTDYHHLQPMYERLQKMVREIDNEHLIFFEPVPADSSAEQTGFTEVPGGEAYQNRSVLSFHYYDPPNHPMPVHFNSRKDDMDRLHTGGMLTEFNCASINVTQPGGKWTSGLGSTNTMVETTDLCDDHLLSWIGWEYKPYYPITGASYSVWRPDGSINSEFLATLARTYPTEVAGRTQGFSFNNSTAEFWLNYTTTPASSVQNSTVYLHELYHYPNGYEMEFLNNNEHLFKVSKPMTNYISLAPAGEVPEGTEINIRITRK